MAEQEVKKFQSENNVEIVGTLEKLEVRDTKNDGSPLQSKDGIPMKTAKVTVQVAEGEKFTIDMMAMKHYKSKPDEDSPAWKAFSTFATEYISREDTQDEQSEHFGASPSVVRVRGNFDANVYYNQKSGQLVEGLRYQGRFLNRMDDITPEDFGATFQVSGFIKSSPVPELDKDGEETGRQTVELAVIDYQNKAFPIKMVAGTIQDEDGEDIDIAGFLEEYIEKGQTMTFSGTIINRFVIKEVPRPNQGFGKKIVDTIRDRTNEIVIEGGSNPINYDEADEETEATKVVFPDQMKEALDNYEKLKADTEAAGGTKKTEKPKKGFAGAKKANGAKKVAGKKKAAVTDDLPF